MPRTLTRLRYRAPPKPIPFPRLRDGPHMSEEFLERKVAAYVVRQSNPSNVRLQVVVNPRARPQATGKSVVAPYKPFTLRDVVDPQGKARHGEIIYAFRNVKTNQIIYSLQELLNDHHLEQLPFIGKHSKPPVLRPDEWTPHCVVTFPTPEQGYNAYRKLREFRKLHELAWDKTNPEWKHAPIKQRIKNIMDQRANTTADLAEVLRIQETHGAKMTEALEQQQQRAAEYMNKKWVEIDALANAAVAKEQVADNVKWLEHQIRLLTLKLNMKHNQNETDQRRLKNAKNIQEIRLRKLQYAVRKAEQFKTAQEDLGEKAAPANEFGAEEKLDEMRKQAQILEEAVANPDPMRSAQDVEEDREILAKLQTDIVALEQAFEAKTQFEARDHYIARSVLPPQLKKTLPTPFALENVRIMWADIQDALYASGLWPEVIEHEILDVYKLRNETALLSMEDYAGQSHGEISSILQNLNIRRQGSEPSSYVTEQKYSSVLGMLPQGKDIFKTATA